MKYKEQLQNIFDSILQVVLAADHFQTRKEWDYHPIKKFPFLSLAIMKLPSAPQHTYENNRVRNFAVLYTYTPYYVLFMKCISLVLDFLIRILKLCFTSLFWRIFLKVPDIYHRWRFVKI